METDQTTLDCLLEGDPAIRWQVMRDVLEQPPAVWEAERAKVATRGWGARLLAAQDADGNWGGGIYNPKWTSKTYSLLSLRELGLIAPHPQAQRGCEHFLEKGFENDGGISLFKSIHYSETCVNGMLLALLSYFRAPGEGVHQVAEFLLGQQMSDGGWNCQWNPKTCHRPRTHLSTRLSWPSKASPNTRAYAQRWLLAWRRPLPADGNFYSSIGSTNRIEQGGSAFPELHACAFPRAGIRLHPRARLPAIGGCPPRPKSEGCH
jgi:hypothetical protein